MIIQSWFGVLCFGASLWSHGVRGGGRLTLDPYSYSLIKAEVREMTGDWNLDGSVSIRFRTLCGTIDARCADARSDETFNVVGRCSFATSSQLHKSQRRASL